MFTLFRSNIEKISIMSNKKFYIKFVPEVRKV